MADLKTLPGPGPSVWDPLLEEPGHRSQTLSGKRHFRALGYKRWRFSMAWRDLPRGQAQTLIDFLVEHGEHTPFLMTRPEGGDPVTVRLDGPLEPWRVRAGLRTDVSIDVVEEL